MPSQMVQDFVSKNRFYPRSKAGHGLWVFFLLPCSVIISSIRHPIILTPTYKLSTVTSFSLLCNSSFIIFKCLKNERLKEFSMWSLVIGIITGCLFNIYLHKGWLFSILTGLFTTVIFFKVYLFLLISLKENFTLGEAGLASQAVVLFIINTGYNLVDIFIYNIGKFVPKSNMQVSTIIIQVGLLGIMLLGYTLYKFNIRTPITFYSTAFFILMVSVILPLHIILDQSPILWIFGQILGDISLLKLFIYWSFCIGLAVLAIKNQIFYAQKASTATRKIFHILAVSVYLPGLYYRCSFLYLSTGVILGLFFVLEMLRILLIPPLGIHLQEGYMVLRDEKDSGLLALTPIYLLIGLSLPIWLHPSPCDITDSAQFTILPLLSGILSVGVGDTAASYVGSKIGKFRWKGTTKTIEGTLAFIFSQFSCVYFLYYLGCLPFIRLEHLVKIGVSIVAGSLVEANTTQIDNIVIPLVAYLFLI